MTIIKHFALNARYYTLSLVCVFVFVCVCVCRNTVPTHNINFSKTKKSKKKDEISNWLLVLVLCTIGVCSKIEVVATYLRACAFIVARAHS